MKYIFSLLFSVIQLTSLGQKLSGQWSGDFGTSSQLSDQKTEYILEIEVNGSEIKGFSYTYFSLGNRRCFVICKLAGTYDKNSKSMMIAETDKIKSNTPPDFRDCLQKHELTYLKTSGKEILSGKWTPIDPKSGCGSGITLLERKPLEKTINANGKNDIASKSANLKEKSSADNTNIDTEGKKYNNAAASESKKTETVSIQDIQNDRKSNVHQKAILDVNGKNIITQTLQPKTKFNERSFQILKTIELDNSQFKIELYDNGQVDGDTVSLYLNNQLIVSQKRLSTSPITLNIIIDNNREYSELVMYAENLGSIPPNTALMVVTDGEKRYELNISSSEMTNGTVRFKLKNK